MRACSRCFVAPTWIANASPSESSAGNCAFGHDYQAETWPTTAWVDSLTQLAQLYEPTADGGLSLGEHAQNDWQVFTFAEPERIQEFLASSLGEAHELLQPGAFVKLRSADDDDGSDALTAWEHFSEEIRTRNRYFPQTVPDRQVLERVLREHVQPIRTDVEMFRARIVDGCAAPEDMGAPPPELTVDGRANPAGIPYLYLAFSKETCIYESRAGNHSRLAIAAFKPARDLQVLNLADIDAPDFFDIEDIGAVDQQVRRISSHRYLVALGNELRKPVRSTDHISDYIPTQYLCELAKSLALDGVLYSSSQHSNGRNVVLFDVQAADCAAEIEVIEIRSIQATWEAPDCQ